MNYEEIFTKIDERRKELGFSIARVCRHADISQSSWKNLKNANKEKGYNTKTLQVICNVLGIKEITLKF
jgi:transcriptional regulator with XRE-family HTH domain